MGKELGVFVQEQKGVLGENETGNEEARGTSGNPKKSDGAGILANALACLQVFLLAASVGRAEVQTTKLLSPQPWTGTRFGSAVAIDGAHLAVGAPTTGPFPVIGSVTLYELNSEGAWQRTVILTPPSPQGQEMAGMSVALDAPYLLVGTPGTNYRAGGALIYSLDNPTSKPAALTPWSASGPSQYGNAVTLDGGVAVLGSAGSSYSTLPLAVFEHRGAGLGGWERVAELGPKGAANSKHFGMSVGVSGYTVIAGAYDDGPSMENLCGAAYIFDRNTNGGWSQTARLLPSDGAPGDWFGQSVAISGNVALVGAPMKAVAGEEAGEKAGSGQASSGTVYVFERDLNTTWTQTAVLTVPDQPTVRQFGYSVSLRGSIAVVTSFQGEGASDSASTQGLAFVFRRQADGTWERVAVLAGDQSPKDDWYGWSCAAGHTQVAVGAPRDQVNVGAAYVYNLVSPVHPVAAPTPLISTLAPSDPDNAGYFGGAVDMKGPHLLVGARWASALYPYAGSAYLFEWLQPGSWEQIAKLAVSDVATSGAEMGAAVALGGDDLVALGAPYYERGAQATGAVFLFRPGEQGVWEEAARLLPDDKPQGQRFGSAVAICGDEMLVGAPRGGWGTGAAFFFRRGADGQWTQASRVVPGDSVIRFEFGTSVALEDSIALIGAPNSTLPSQSAAFIFERAPEGQWKQKTILQIPAYYDVGGLGRSVALDGRRAIVGAFNVTSNRGASYVFERDEQGGWNLVSRVVGYPFSSNGFGFSVDIQDQLIATGAFLENSRGAAYLHQVEPGGCWERIFRFETLSNNSQPMFGRSVALDYGRLAVGSVFDTLSPDEKKAYGKVYVYEFLDHIGRYEAARVINGGDSGAPVSMLDANGDGIVDTADIVRMEIVP